VSGNLVKFAQRFVRLSEELDLTRDAMKRLLLNGATATGNPTPARREAAAVQPPESASGEASRRDDRQAPAIVAGNGDGGDRQGDATLESCGSRGRRQSDRRLSWNAGRPSQYARKEIRLNCQYFVHLGSGRGSGRSRLPCHQGRRPSSDQACRSCVCSRQRPGELRSPWDSRSCHVWTPLADQGLFLALRGWWVRSCLRPSFAENRIRWP
jgi:hypothetical protein